MTDNEYIESTFKFMHTQDTMYFEYMKKNMILNYVILVVILKNMHKPCTVLILEICAN